MTPTLTPAQLGAQIANETTKKIVQLLTDIEYPAMEGKTPSQCKYATQMVVIMMLISGFKNAMLPNEWSELIHEVESLSKSNPRNNLDAN